MKKSYLIVGLALILLLAGLTSFGSGYAWLSGWQYRQAIVISNPSTANLTDYQIKLNVTYETGMNADFSDLRFTDSAGNSIPYWIQNYSASSWALVWVKVPTISASSNTTIYMYFGNSTATSESNKTAVLDEWEGFNGASAYSITVVGGVATYSFSTARYVEGNASLEYTETSTTAGDTVKVRSGTISNENYEGDLWFNLNLSTSYQANAVKFWFSGNDTVAFGYDNPGSTSAPVIDFYNTAGQIGNCSLPSDLTLDVWYREHFTYDGATWNVSLYDASGNYIASCLFNYALTINQTGINIATGAGQNGNIFVDNFMLYKYSDVSLSIAFGVVQSISLVYPTNTTYYKPIDHLEIYTATYPTNVTYEIDGTNYTATLTQEYTNISYNFTVGTHTIKLYYNSSLIDSVTFTIDTAKTITLNTVSSPYELGETNATFKVYAYNSSFANVYFYVNGTRVSTFALTYNSTDAIGNIYTGTFSTKLPLANVSATWVSNDGFNVSVTPTKQLTTLITFTPKAPYIANGTNIVETSNNQWSFSIPIPPSGGITNVSFALLNGTTAIASYNSSLLSLSTANGNYTFLTPIFAVPLVSTSTNLVGNFTYEIYDNYGNSETRSTSSTITDDPLYLTTSAVTGGTQTVNITFADEDTLSPLTNVNMTFIATVSLPNGTTKQYSGIETTSTSSVVLYLYPAYASTNGSLEIDYSKSNYTTRQYFNPNFEFSSVISHLSLLLLNSSEAHEFVTQVTDEVGTPLPNYYVYVNRFYPQINAYKNVEIQITNDLGEAIFHLRFGDTPYQITVMDQNHNVVKELTPTILAEKYIDGYTIFQIVIGTLNLPQLQTAAGVSYNITWNPTTKTFQGKVYSPDGKYAPFCMDVYRQWGWQSIQVCHSCVNSVDQVMLCQVNDTNANYKVVLYGNPFPQTVEYFNFKGTTQDKELTSIFVIAILGIIVFTITIVNPVVGLIMWIITIIIGNFMGIMSVPINALFGLIMAIAFTVWWMVKRGR